MILNNDTYFLKQVAHGKEGRWESYEEASGYESC